MNQLFQSILSKINPRINAKSTIEVSRHNLRMGQSEYDKKTWRGDSAICGTLCVCQVTSWGEYRIINVLLLSEATVIQPVSQFSHCRHLVYMYTE